MKPRSSGMKHPLTGRSGEWIPAAGRPHSEMEKRISQARMVSRKAHGDGSGDIPCPMHFAGRVHRHAPEGSVAATPTLVVGVRSD